MIPGTVADSLSYSDEELRLAFLSFDLDKNSFVGVAEIKHLMGLIGEQVTDEEIDEMIKMGDSEGYGQVSWEGFHGIFKKGSAESPSKTEDRVAIISNQIVASTIQNMTLLEVINKFTDFQLLKPTYIKKIYKRFVELDVTRSGRVKYIQFLDILQVDDSALMQRMFELLDFDSVGAVEMKDMIISLSNHTESSRTDKLKFAFLMFDDEGRGWISRDHLRKILRANFPDTSSDDIELREADIIKLAGLNPDNDNEPITYEKFMTISKTNASLIFPVVQLS